MKPLSILFLLAGCGDGPSDETVITDLFVVAQLVDEAGTVEALIANPQNRDIVVQNSVCTQTGCTKGDPLQLNQPGFLSTLVCDLQVCDPSEAPLADLEGWLAEQPIEGVFLAQRFVFPGGFSNPIINDTPSFERSDSVELSFKVENATAAFGYATVGGFSQPAYIISAGGNVTLEWLSNDSNESGEAYVVFTNNDGGVSVWQTSIPAKKG